MPKATDQTVHQRALERWDEAESGWDENYQRARLDVEMLSGRGQWSSLDRAIREQDHRPCLTFNRLPSFVDAVVGDARQQRPQIKVSAASMEGLSTVRTLGDAPREITLSDTMDGLIRYIQRASFAHIAYDTAIEHAAGWGIGWIRVVKEYSAADPFVHELRIKRVSKWDSVLMDPNSTDPTGADAKYCFVWSTLAEDVYEESYGKDRTKADWQVMPTGWYEKNRGVRICEYFERRKTKRTAARLSDGRVVFADTLEGIQDELAENDGVVVVESKDVDHWKVERYVLDGLEVLEGPLPIECQWIPVIPVFGKELDEDGECIRRGVVRYSHDAQRSYNYAKTTAVERVSLTPKAPTRMTPEQLGTFQTMWDDNRPRKYLLYRHQPGVPPPFDPPIVDVDAGATLMAESALDDLRGTTGIHESGLGQREGEESGRAILALQRKGENATFAYVDNQSRSIAQVGRVLSDWVPHVYDTARVVSILNEDDTEAYVMLRQEVYDEETGQIRVVHDLSATSYEVSVTVGPSYATLRAEAAESMIGMAQADPALMPTAGDLVYRNMDWPGAQEIADRRRRTIPPEILGDEEEAEQPPQPPTPEQEVDMAKAQADLAKAQADQEMARAKQAEAELKTAEVQRDLAMLPKNIQAMVTAEVRSILQQPVESLGFDNGNQ
jgi:hypothetical protein